MGKIHSPGQRQRKVRGPIISGSPPKPLRFKYKKARPHLEIPALGFRNKHLPILRAQYLREMISAYSKKFDPIVLEGTVKDFKDKAERNAIIYLFIPEELVEVYGGN